MDKRYNVLLFSEERYTVLGRVLSTLAKRRIRVESLGVSPCELDGVFRFSFEVTCAEAKAALMVAQLERVVDVLKAFVVLEGTAFGRQLSLYKVEALYADASLEVEVMHAGGRVVAREEDYVVVALLSEARESDALLESLRPYGVVEFVRSGRVVVTQPMRSLETFFSPHGGELRVA